MLFDLLFFGFLFWLSIPLVCGYYASTRGRSFWLWFFLGAFLPVLSYLILAFLPDQSKPSLKELDELRMQYSMMGTRQEVPASVKKKIASSGKNIVLFDSTLHNGESYPRLSILINGEALLDILYRQNPRMAGKIYSGIPLEYVKPPSFHLLGYPDDVFQGHKGRTALLAELSPEGKVVRMVMARIEIHLQYVVWSDFACIDGRTLYRFSKTDMFVFDRLQYMEALDAISSKTEQA
jgi:hypothetical protein